MDQRTLKLLFGSGLVVAAFVAVFAREDLTEAIYVAAYGLLGAALAALESSAALARCRSSP